MKTERTERNPRVSRDDRESQHHQSTDRVYGVMPVLEALRAGKRTIDHIAIADGVRHERLSELLELARAVRVPIRKVPRAELERALGALTHQGVVAKIAAARYTDADDLL